MELAERLIWSVLLAFLTLAALTVRAEPPSAKATHTLYLVRHGAYEAHANVTPEVGGDLTPLGIAEARLVAARLKGLPVRFDSMASSTMARSRETAAIIHQSLP